MKRGKDRLMTTENFQVSAACSARYIFPLISFYITLLFTLGDALFLISSTCSVDLMDTLIHLPPDEDGAQYDDNEPPAPILPEMPEDESEDFFDILTFDNHFVQHGPLASN